MKRHAHLLATLVVFGSTGLLQAELNFQMVTLDPSYLAYERDIADVNNDGANDVVSVSEDDNLIRAFLAPDWTKVTLATPTGTHTWARADDFKSHDMDGDGDTDLIVRLGPGQGSDAPGIAAWFENQGATGWVQRTIGPSSGYVKDICVGDLDRDGRPDVVMRQDSQTDVYLQEPGGGWTMLTIAHAAHEGMELADLDRDGDPDIVLNGFWFPTPDTPAAVRNAAAYTNHTIDAAWFNQSGDWTANSCKVVVGDFNGDGTNDVAFSQSERAGYAITWYRNATPHNDATWISNTVATIDYCHNLQAVDWDLDGDVDLLAGGMTQSQHKGLRLFLNAGGGASWSEFIIQSDGSYSAEIGDIDNDGDVDIAGIRNWDSAPTYIYRNNSGGGPSLDFWKYLPVSVNHVRTFGLAFPDIDGDGDRDIASGPYIYRNPGGAMTSAWTQVTLPGSVFAFLATDIDGDDRADVLALHENVGQNRIDLFWMEGTDANATAWTNVVRFGDVPRSDHAEGFQGYELADLVAGERPELVISTMQGVYQFVIPASGAATGSWPKALLAVNDSDEGIGVGDIDGDNLPDIAFTRGSDKAIRWAHNPGTGGGGWTNYTIGSFPEADWVDRCAIADFNGDGRMDIVATEENSGGAPDALTCWWERSTNAFALAWTRHVVATQYTMNAMSVADVSQDGVPDLVIGEHRGTKKIGVWENAGDGTFIEHPVDAGKESHLGARAVDLDGDGDFDIVSICYDDFTKVHAWRNDSPSGTPHAARPIISPAGGVFDESVNVTLTTGTPGATIWYTLDNGDPTNAAPSTLYTGSFAVVTSVQVRARSFKDAFEPSTIASATFTGPKVRAPVIAPSGGTFASQAVVTITCATTGTTIRFTTNGAAPDVSAPVYSGSFTVHTTTTVRARAFRVGLSDSDEASALFTIVGNGTGPLSHWRFDERFGATAFDSIGGHHGTLVGPSRTNGYFDRALAFDGVDSRVNLGGIDANNPTGFTACAWVWADPGINDGNDPRILSKATGTAESDHYWMLSTYLVSTDRRLRFRLKTGGSTTTLIASSGNLTAGAWHHVAITYDGATMAIFMDGASVGSAAKTGDLDMNAGVNAFVGASPPAGVSAFKGLIDDVRIYGRALDATALQGVMSDAPPPPAHPVSGVAPAGTNFSLKVLGTAGHYSILQATSNLVVGPWLNVATQLGAAVELEFLPPLRAVAEAFRVSTD